MTPPRCPACGSKVRARRDPLLPPGMSPFSLPPGALPPPCTDEWHLVGIDDG